MPAYVFHKLPGASIKALRMVTVEDADRLDGDYLICGECFSAQTDVVVGGYRLWRRVLLETHVPVTPA